MEIEHIFLHNEPRVYADIVKTGDGQLFLSGLISQDLASGELLHGDITFQTKTVLCNLKTILEQHGSDMDHIIRIEVILKSFAERDEMNREYVRHFSADHLPARLCFGNVALASDMKIEIMALAVLK